MNRLGKYINTKKASENSFPPREQRPTRVQNEPSWLTYYAPGYSINNIGIRPTYAVPSFHDRPYYCTPSVQPVFYTARILDCIKLLIFRNLT